MEQKDLTNVLNSLNNILSNTDLSDVSAESNNFTELPDGYYLSEVESAILTESKSSHLPMVAMTFKVVEDGRGTNKDGEFFDLKKTKNRKIFMYYVLKDEVAVRRYVADMLKFEGDVEGQPLLDKECFTNSELLVDALDILTGMRVYIQISTTENQDKSTSTWKNLISWKRAKALELN